MHGTVQLCTRTISGLLCGFIIIKILLLIIIMCGERLGRRRRNGGRERERDGERERERGVTDSECYTRSRVGWVVRYVYLGWPRFRSYTIYTCTTYAELLHSILCIYFLPMLSVHVSHTSYHYPVETSFRDIPTHK